MEFGVGIFPAHEGIAVHSGDGDLDLLYRFFAEWEMWTAEVLESHTSYPMLALFRSQHPGQSWVIALGVVTDAATLTCACVAGAENREPYFAYRRGRRAVIDIADRLHLAEPGESWSWLTRENFELAWSALAGLRLPLRDKEEAWRRLQNLRAPYVGTYGAHLQQLIDYLLAPHGFWGALGRRNPSLPNWPKPPPKPAAGHASAARAVAPPQHQGLRAPAAGYGPRFRPALISSRQTALPPRRLRRGRRSSGGAGPRSEA